MTAIETAINSGSQYANILDTLLNSGEISQTDPKTTEVIEQTILTVRQTNSLLSNYGKKELKGQIITGEFSLKGRQDIDPSSPIEIEIFGNKIAISNIENIKSEVIGLIGRLFTIDPSDLLFFHSSIDYRADQLDFNFAFQTNDETHRVDKGTDIALLTPARKLTTGYTYRNRIDFSNTTIKELPNEIWNYPNYSFKIPYFLTNDPVDLLSRIRIATTGSYGGYLADLRFWGPTFRSQVDGFVNTLKTNKWKTILTQWERFYLNADGNTYRAIKMK